MIYKLAILRDEIEEEFTNIDKLRLQVQDIRKENRDLNLELKTRLNASVLADFYMAVEKIFKLIAKEIDSELPYTENWHKKLLRQMSVEIPEIRPAVIDKKLFHMLEEYLKFRHLVRNIYGFQLEGKRFVHLVEELAVVIEDLETQVTDFLEKIQEIAKNVVQSQEQEGNEYYRRQ